MATFKVGQRVKRARPCTHGVPLGSVGVITGFKAQSILMDEEEAYIKWDDATLNAQFPHPYSFDQTTLEPLVDDGAERFLESIRTMKPYSEPVVTPVHGITFAKAAMFNDRTYVCLEGGVWEHGPDGWRKIEPR